jgi:hypothetical protein
MKIEIVTFNDREANAVLQLFVDLNRITDGKWCFGVDAESRTILQCVNGTVVKHIALGAQGNVSSAGALSRFYKRHESGDVILFYGCSGALEQADFGRPFIVQGEFDSL